MLTLKLYELKEISQIILAAVDSNELSILTETLELKLIDNILYMSVTNKEYYAQVRLKIDKNEIFHATVNATLFLKLISQLTTEEVALKVDTNYLLIKSNGLYKIPLIYENNRLLELPKIELNNISNEFDMDGNILVSILNYNSKQLNIGIQSNPVQRMYYLDNKGAITFTSGACVNNFALEQPIKILLNNRLVKLFRLFKDKKVHFKLGYDELDNKIIYSKVSFESDTIKINAILNRDFKLIDSIPVEAIRNRANSNYPYSVILNRNRLIQLINRLLLFTLSNTKESSAYCKLDFLDNELVVYDFKGENKESIKYEEGSSIETSYAAILDLTDIKKILEIYNDEKIVLKFGDKEAIAFCRENTVNIIPECDIVE